MSLNHILQIFAGFIGTLGFAVWFNIRGKRLAFASLGGFLSWSLYIILSNFISNEAINYLLVSIAVSLYAEIVARLLKTPTTPFLTTSLVPLIPGASLYYTMSYAFGENIGMFSQKAIYTLELASALALGIIISTTIAKIFLRPRGDFNAKGKKI